MTQYFLFKYNLLIVRFFFFIHISNDALNWLLNLSLLHHWEEFFIIRGYIKPCQAVQNQSRWGTPTQFCIKKCIKHVSSNLHGPKLLENAILKIKNVVIVHENNWIFYQKKTLISTLMTFWRVMTEVLGLGIPITIEEVFPNLIDR